MEVGARPYRAFAAIREIPDGDIQFGISGLQINDHQFSLWGIATPVGDAWQFKQRPIKSIDIGHGLSVEEIDAMAEPNCKVMIRWNRRDRLAFEVDERADCRDEAGYHFGEKSIRFVPGDYVGPVRDELDETSEDFLDSGRCWQEDDASRPSQKPSS